MCFVFKMTIIQMKGLLTSKKLGRKSANNSLNTLGNINGLKTKQKFYIKQGKRLAVEVLY